MKVRSSFLEEAAMPHFEFICRICNKEFSRILALVDTEKAEITCPYCGSHDVEQLWSTFSTFTAEKCA